MKRSTQLISGFASVLACAALLGGLLCLSKINNNCDIIAVNYPALCAALAAAYLIDLLLIEKRAPVPLFALAQALIAAGAVFVLFRAVSFVPYRFGSYILFSIIYALLALSAAFTAWMPSGHSGMVMRFDLLAALLLILLIVDNIAGLYGTGSAAAMTAAAMCACLVSLVSDSAGHGGGVEGNPLLGKLLLGGTAAVVALFALALISASSGVHSLSEWIKALFAICWNALKSAGIFLWHLLERLVRFLAELFPASAEPVPPEGMPAMQAPEEMPIYGDGALPAYIYAIPALAVIAIICFIVFRLRRARLTPSRIGFDTSANVRRKSRFGKAISDALSRLRKRAEFFINCIARRKSAPALLAFCERRARRCCPRNRGESGEAFVRRLSQRTEDNSAADALRALADLLEREFYSPHAAEVSTDLFKAVHRLKIGDFSKK